MTLDLKSFFFGMSSPVLGLIAGLFIPIEFGQKTDEKLCLFLQAETGSTRKAKILLRYAREYDLDPLFFAAACYRESGFDPKAYAKRPKGAMGAGDVDRGWFGMYWKTACEICEKEWHDKHLAQQIRERPALLYEPELNADLAGQNFRRLLDEHGSVHDMFDAYARHNSGDGGKGSLENVTAVKDKYYEYSEKYEKFDWRKAR